MTFQLITIHDPKPSLGQLQKAVGGLIETVNLADGEILLVNEEGLLHDFKLNPLASARAGFPIYGPAAIVKEEQLR